MVVAVSNLPFYVESKKHAGPDLFPPFKAGKAADRTDR